MLLKLVWCGPAYQVETDHLVGTLRRALASDAHDYDFAVSLAVPTLWSRSRTFAIARRSLRPSRTEALILGFLSDGRSSEIVARKNGRAIGCPKLAQISCQSEEISQSKFRAEHYWLPAYPTRLTPHPSSLLPVVFGFSPEGGTSLSRD